MTWIEFKKHLEAAGVRDDDQIDFIEIEVPDSEALLIDRKPIITGGVAFSVTEKFS